MINRTSLNRAPMPRTFATPARLVRPERWRKVAVPAGTTRVLPVTLEAGAKLALDLQGTVQLGGLPRLADGEQIWLLNLSAIYSLVLKNDLSLTQAGQRLFLPGAADSTRTQYRVSVLEYCEIVGGYLLVSS